MVMSRRAPAAALLLILSSSGAPALAADRLWTAETSIESRHFALNFLAPQHWPQPGEDPRGLLFAPDRRHFLFIEYRGDLAADETVARVSIFSSDAVRQALQRRGRQAAPRRQFEMRSRSSRYPAIGQLRWDEDGSGILFEGFDPEGVPKIFHFALESGLAEPLVTLPADRRLARAFDYRRGTFLLFLGETRPGPPPSYPGQWLDRGPDGRPLFGRPPPGAPQPAVRSQGICAGRPALVSDIASDVPLLAVSPTRCRALVLVPRAGGGFDYRLLDIASGRSRSVAPAPAGGVKAISWSPDGQWALLSNVEGAGRSAAAMLSLAAGEAEPVAGLVPGDAQPRFRPVWLSPSQLVVADLASPTGASRLDLRAGTWSRRPGVAPPPQGVEDLGFSVGLRQGLNDPSRVVARSGWREIVLSRPDPALADVARRDWQVIAYRSPSGTPAHAALMLPAPVPGRAGPPPLVVNPYWFENYGGSYDRLFLPDGMHDGAESAAQALAARGMAVLWMDGFENPAAIGSPGEGADFVARVDGLLEQLIGQGLVDPQRIGMAGYSRGGYLSLYSATHPGRVAIRTHVAIDNFLGSTATQFFDRTQGANDRIAPNFFLDRQGLIERDTLLNADRVRGPVLFTRSLRGVGEQPEWTRFWVGLQILQGAFMAARRPFDQLSFPEGMHNLHRPRERLMLINAMTDWMAYWLMDQAPADPERARIWNQLRRQWQRQQAWEAAGNPVGSAPLGDLTGGASEEIAG